MPGYFLRRMAFFSLLLGLIMTGCTYTGDESRSAYITQPEKASGSPIITTQALYTSTAHITSASGLSQSYLLHTTELTSELRHGHREFTIMLSDSQITLFIVFFGYQGPGTYTLSNTINGGDVHIGLQNDTHSWDLLMQHEAHCSLHVISDTPTDSPGLNRMQGSFSCPLLLSSSPAYPQKPITDSSGSFDIAIIVAN